MELVFLLTLVNKNKSHTSITTTKIQNSYDSKIDEIEPYENLKFQCFKDTVNRVKSNLGKGRKYFQVLYLKRLYKESLQFNNDNKTS